MFGSKKREREAAQNTARSAALSAWFDAVARARPAGLGELTQEMLQVVGDPYSFLPSGGTADADVERQTTHYLAREWAARLSRKAILENDPDATVRHQFWQSVSNWL
jgi:hypothetical protein